MKKGKTMKKVRKDSWNAGPGRVATRRNISQPESWWLAFERTAKKQSMSLSAWVGECCRNCVKESLEDRYKLGSPAAR